MAGVCLRWGSVESRPSARFVETHVSEAGGKGKRMVSDPILSGALQSSGGSRNPENGGGWRERASYNKGRNEVPREGKCSFQ